MDDGIEKKKKGKTTCELHANRGILLLFKNHREWHGRRQGPGEGSHKTHGQIGVWIPLCFKHPDKARVAANSVNSTNGSTFLYFRAYVGEGPPPT